MNFEKATWQIATNRNHVFFAYSKSVDNEWGGLDRKGCAFIGTPTMEVPFSNSKIISLVISRLYPHYIYPKYIYIYSYLVYPRVNVHRDVENSCFPEENDLHMAGFPHLRWFSGGYYHLDITRTIMMIITVCHSLGHFCVSTIWLVLYAIHSGRLVPSRKHSVTQ